MILQGRHLFEKRFSSPHPIFQKLLYAIRPGLLSQSGQIAIKFCKKGVRREVSYFSIRKDGIGNQEELIAFLTGDVF